MRDPADMREEAKSLSRMLAARMLSVIEELRLTGERRGHDFVAFNPTRGDRSLGSFRITLDGPKAGKWRDYSTDDHGDALALVAYVLYAGRVRDAVLWAKRSLGLEAGPVPPAVRRAAPPPASDEEISEERERKRRAGHRLWLEAEASIAGTPAAAYLLRRGIDLARLGRQPAALRYAPRLWQAQVRAHFPSLVAAIHNDAGVHVSTHRTFLAQAEGGAWKKAPVPDPKMALGNYTGGCIRLWKGASGKALKDAPAGDQVAIAEGIETALSVAIACPELRVLCAVSLPNMANIALPPAIGTVFLCADHDPPEGRGAERRQQLLARAIAHYRAITPDVRLAMPEVVGADWNDILQGVEG